MEKHFYKKFDVDDVTFNEFDQLDSKFNKPISKKEFISKKKSDLVFIMGSGASLLDITQNEWSRIAEHDTFSFNWFVYQNFIDVDFHLSKEISPTIEVKERWIPDYLNYASYLNNNPRFENTHYIFQNSPIGLDKLINAGLLQNKKYIRYDVSSRSKIVFPSLSFDQGLVHGHATLIDVLNACLIFGWKKIALAGIDLYDMRYYWLESYQIRQACDIKEASEAGSPKHNTSSNVIQHIAFWRKIFNEYGVEVWVHNPKSLLNECLPVFDWETIDQKRFSIPWRRWYRPVKPFVSK